jgi:hypothetical protein
MIGKRRTFMATAATQEEVNNILNDLQPTFKLSPDKGLTRKDAEALAAGLTASNHSTSEIIAAIVAMEQTPIDENVGPALVAPYTSRANALAKKSNMDADTVMEVEAKLVEAQKKIFEGMDRGTVVNINKYGFAYHGLYYKPPSFLAKQTQEFLAADVQTKDTLTIISNEVLKIGQGDHQVPYEQADEAVAKYLREQYDGQSNIYTAYINEQIPRLYQRATAGNRTAAELAEARSKYQNLAFEFLDLFPDLSAEDLESHSPKANAAWDWLNGRKGSKREGQPPLSYAELKPFADTYNLMRGFPNALRKLIKEQIEFDAASLPPEKIEQLHDFYKNFMGLDAKGKPTKTYMEASLDKNFRKAWQTLPQPLQKLVLDSTEGESKLALINASTDSQLKQLGASGMKAAAEVMTRAQLEQKKKEDGGLPLAQQERLSQLQGLQADTDAKVLKIKQAFYAKHGFDDIEALKRAVADGSFTKELNDTVDKETGQPIEQTVRKEIMADAQSQIGLQTAAAQNIIQTAEASNAPQLARVTKWGLDIAEDMLKGKGGGTRGIMNNLLGGDNLMGIVTNQMEETGAASPCPVPLRFAGLPRMGGIGGIFGGRGMMGHGRRVDAGGDVVDPVALAQLAMNNPGQLAEKMGGMFTGASNGRQPRPDQRAVELATKTAKAETKKPPTRVVAARHDISDV